LAKLFQRRRLKYEKLTDNGPLPGELKKDNNFKMGNQIYFKIAGHVDLDMLHMFAV
jgi:hypothetical protein